MRIGALPPAAAAGVFIAAMLASPAWAQVKDGVYRGTLVCDQGEASKGKRRGAIEVTISGGNVSYQHTVRASDRGRVFGVESGSGTLQGQALKLDGSWSGQGENYKASYSGTFVRRGAQLTGTQVWTAGDKSQSRTCTGAIKRPLAIFMR